MKATTRKRRAVGEPGTLHDVQECIGGLRIHQQEIAELGDRLQALYDEAHRRVHDQQAQYASAVNTMASLQMRVTKLEGTLRTIIDLIDLKGALPSHVKGRLPPRRTRPGFSG